MESPTPFSNPKTKIPYYVSHAYHVLLLRFKLGKMLLNEETAKEEKCFLTRRVMLMDLLSWVPSCVRY